MNAARGPRRALRRLAGLLAVMLMLGGSVLVYRGVLDAGDPEPAPVPPVLFTTDDPDTYQGPNALQAATQQGQAGPSARSNNSGAHFRDLEAHADGGANGTADAAQSSGPAGAAGSVSQGPQVVVPAVGLSSPLMATGGRDGWLVLPEPPHSTWYERSAPIEATSGSTVIASHVDHGHGESAPFGQLWRVQKGTPVLVRDFAGRTWAFEVDEVTVHERTGLPESIFDPTGERRLYLVTCSGDVISGADQPYYENNLVVGTHLIGEVIDTGQGPELVTSSG